MPIFVHLTYEKAAKRILSNGIAARSLFQKRRGIYAMPVVRNFYVSHQWLRELKRGGQKTIVGVYFRVDDAESVLIGHYREPHNECTAAEAAGFLSSQRGAEGYEVFIPHRIEAKDIIRIKTLPQVIGWRYYPEARGHKPCGCPGCQRRGEIRSRRIRDQYEKL